MTCQRPRSRLFLNLILTLMALAGAAWATYMADRGRSWDVTCYGTSNCDGLTFTVVSELLAEGQTPYRESVRRAHISETRLSGAEPIFDLPFQYPPNALPLFALRSIAPPRAVHLGTAFLTTLVCLLLFSHLVRERLPDTRRRALLMLGVSFSGAIGLNGDLGQTGSIAAALVVAITLSWKHAPVAAGLLLGALAFKPQYAGAILVVAVIRREWRLVTGAVGAFSALTIASGIWYGFDEWSSFSFAVGQPNHTVSWMVNWMGVVWRVAPGGQEEILQAAALPVFLVAGIAVGAGLWPLRQRTGIEGQLAAAMAWSVLFSPNTHPYDLLVLMPALVYVSGSVPRAKVGLLFCLITWFTLPQPLRWIGGLALVGFAAFCTCLLRREALSRRAEFRPLTARSKADVQPIVGSGSILES